MTIYKDKKFCCFGNVCSNSHDCDEILTTEEMKELRKSKMPVAFYSELPPCFS